MLRWICRLLCLVVVPAGSGAQARETVALVTRAGKDTPEGAERLVRLVEALLNREEGMLAWVPAQPVDPQMVSEGSQAARRLVEQAREAYKKFDHQKSLELLEKSTRELVRGCGGADDELLRSRFLLTGLNHFMRDNRDEAKLAFSRLAAVDPAWHPEEGKLAPKIVALFNSARTDCLDRPRALLSLEGIPRGARVELDGRKAGELPLVVDDLLPGEHCVQLTVPGYSDWIKKINVPPGAKIYLRAALFPRPALRVLGSGDTPGVAERGEIARAFGTDFLAVMDMSRQKVSLVVTSAASGRFESPDACDLSAEDADLRKAAECLKGRISGAVERLSASVPLEGLPGIEAGKGAAEPASTPLPAPGGGTSEAPVAVKPAWYSSWWFWTIVGGALAVAGGVTLGAIYGTDGGRDGYRVIITRPE